MLLRLLISTYLAESAAVRSPHTHRLFETSAKHFAAYLQKEPEVTDLTDKNLAGYIRHRQGLKKADATVERESAKLMTLWRFAASYAWVAPPRLRIEKAKPGEPVAFLRGEVRLLFREAANYRTTIGGAPGNVLLVALLSVIWDSAERIGALCEVDQSDIQLVRHWGFVTGGWITIRSRKNGGRTIVRKLRRTTARALGRLFAACPHRKPFGRVHRATLYHHLEQLLRRAGLPTSRRHKFHCLRRSHASYLHRAGGNAQESLDHATAEMTRTHYFDQRITKRWHAVSYLFHPFSWWDRLLGLIR